ncbi:Arm DNA-binding domain-containing protein [Enterovibrio sp. 27052020O]|uniref:Arm DNA-binding domain-containing protein n=1 Tax=Enterovibrio sp. 27052020O TaxID=3241166 RepID=UPI00388FB9E9
MAIPEGVEVRGTSIRLWFMYRGQRCKETLKGWSHTPSNIKKAGRLRAVIVSEISNGVFDYLERFPNSKKARLLSGKDGGKQITTVSELIERWLKIKEAELSADTHNATASQCKTCVNILGPDRLARSITLEDALTLRNSLLDGTTSYTHRANKKGRSASTVNKYLSTFSEIWRFAVASNYVIDNPFAVISHVKKEGRDPDPLEMDEFERLLTHPSITEQERNLWTVACFTGLRHGELCALAWEDIDLVRGELRVTRNIAKEGFRCPKTKSGERTVTLLQPAIDALKRQREITYLRSVEKVEVQTRERNKVRVDSCRWVFVAGLKNKSDSATKHYRPNGISTAWDSCVKRAGIRRRNPYQTRHTFACWMLTEDANPSWIAAQMGHKNAKMVLEVYGKFMPSQSMVQADRLNKKFGQCPIHAPFAKSEKR